MFESVPKRNEFSGVSNRQRRGEFFGANPALLRIFSAFAFSLAMLALACTPGAEPDSELAPKSNSESNFKLNFKPNFKPNVLVILIDALRADRLGIYGYHRDTSPEIDAFASESIVFSRAYAQSPWTKPSVPTLFTSLYPVQHGVYEGEAHAGAGRLESDVLSEAYTTLAETFQSSGYDTVAYVHNAHLDAEGGFAQGFDLYEQGGLSAEEINQRFLGFLDADRSRPFFAYLHYLDAHWPFQPEVPFKDRFGKPTEASIFDRENWKGLRERVNDSTIQLTDEDRARLQDRHDGGVSEIDNQLGQLWTALRERGVLDQTIVLLTSDHGEELLDHGAVGHGGTLFREVIDIPLVLRLPGGADSGSRDQVARLLDVFPTLTALAGVEEPPGIEGYDLLAPGLEIPEIIAETRHKRTYRLSVRQGDWKYVRTYHARRSHSRHAEDEAPAIEAGMRVKAKGFFMSGGEIHATKLTYKSPGDDDVEISGAIESLAPNKNQFHLQGTRISAEDLVDENGSPRVGGLKVGMWVKVEGSFAADGSFEADELEELLVGDRDDEIEGIAQGARLLDDERIEIQLGRFRILVSDDTRLKGFGEGEVRVVTEVEAARPDLFTPGRLLSSDAPPFDEELYDLALDPREQRDRAQREGERVAQMGTVLDAWLARMEPTAARGVDRRALDPATIENLRELGYIE